MPDGLCIVFYQIRCVEARDLIGDTSRHIEDRGVGGRRGGVSVVVGGRLSVGGAIQTLEVGD